MKNQIITKTESQDLEIYISTLKKETEIMRKLATAKGFYKYYFSYLSKFETQEKCFNYINSLYFSVFGCFRYADYSSFKKIKGLFCEN
jgi:hypothetical protein